MLFSLWSSPNHIPIKSRGLIKKTCHWKPYMVHGEHRDSLLNSNHKFQPLCDNFKIKFVSTEGVWVWSGLLFMFFDFYKLVLHNETCVAFANLRWRITKPDFLWLGSCFWKCLLLISSLNIQILPLVFISECRVVVNTIGRHSPIFFKYVSLWCLLVHPH